MKTIVFGLFIMLTSLSMFAQNNIVKQIATSEGPRCQLEWLEAVVIYVEEAGNSGIVVVEGTELSFVEKRSSLPFMKGERVFVLIERSNGASFRAMHVERDDPRL